MLFQNFSKKQTEGKDFFASRPMNGLRILQSLKFQVHIKSSCIDFNNFFDRVDDEKIIEHFYARVRVGNLSTSGIQSCKLFPVLARVWIIEKSNTEVIFITAAQRTSTRKLTHASVISFHTSSINYLTTSRHCVNSNQLRSVLRKYQYYMKPTSQPANQPPNQPHFITINCYLIVQNIGLKNFFVEVLIASKSHP
uniref:Uncharacterized protein n=1 Tax=Glossina pallidipes TaxID=7398 RepID=A0A1B0A7C7_GLOPL